MKIRWLILFFPMVSIVVLSLLVQEHAAKAASPQSAPAASPSEASAAAMTSNHLGALAIPDTTMAINSPAPMSQRVTRPSIPSMPPRCSRTTT